MAGSEGHNTAIEELKTALKAEDKSEKNFHIRQALQLIELDGENPSDINIE